jgi:hypothetical protein
MLRSRIARLEHQHAPGWPGYPAPVFADAHLLETVGILAEALPAETLLAQLAERLGGPVPAALERFIRERRGREHVVTESPRGEPRG